MAALTIPPEVTAECVTKLFAIITSANRDAATLSRHVSALLSGKQIGWLRGTLTRYVSFQQYGANEIQEVIAIIEANMEPERIKRLALAKARRDKEDSEFLKMREKVLPVASALMREGEASRDLIAAVLAFYEQRGGLWDVEVNLPGGLFDQAAQEGKRYWEAMEALKHQGGNVVAGPWEDGREAQP